MTVKKTKVDYRGLTPGQGSDFLDSYDYWMEMAWIRYNDSIRKGKLWAHRTYITTCITEAERFLERAKPLIPSWEGRITIEREETLPWDGP